MLVYNLKAPHVINVKISCYIKLDFSLKKSAMDIKRVGCVVIHDDDDDDDDHDDLYIYYFETDATTAIIGFSVIGFILFLFSLGNFRSKF